MNALVLARHDTGEYDQIVSLLTRERGKVEAFVKGVKKITSKNGPFLEPFFFIEAEAMAGKEMDKLIKAYPLEAFAGIRSDLNKLRLAAYAAYFINTVIQPGARNDGVFDLFLNWLQFLENNKKVRTGLLSGLMLKIYAHLGFQPELGSCTRCRKELKKDHKNIFFSVKEGGILCYSCHANFVHPPGDVKLLSASELKFMRTLLNSGWELINKIKKEEFDGKIQSLIFDFIRYRTERKLAKFSEI